MSALKDDAVLVATPHCVLREQQDQYVIYNSRTDELHLIPVLGYYLYRLCDGLRDVGSICCDFESDDDDAPAARANIVAYLEQLVARGVLQEDRRA